MTYFECYPDESLLKFLGFTNKELAGGHCFGRSRVSGRLYRTTDSIGLIDEDPDKARDQYLKHLFGLNPVYEDGNVVFFRDSKRRNSLIVLRPDLENLIVKLANSAQLNLEDMNYRLSMRPSRLHDMLTPKDNVKQRERLTGFFQDVSGNKSIVTLRQFIKD